jgi:hypothetical protein
MRSTGIGVVVLLASTGCSLFVNPKTIAHERSVERAESSRRAAISRGDFADAMGYDVALGKYNERTAHFHMMIEAELAKIGPLSAATAEARFAMLLALQKVATGDLEASGRERIQPLMVETTAFLAARIDELVAANQLAYAIALAQALIDHAAGDATMIAKRDAAKQKAAAVHIELAAQAGETHPGARLLHAKIALMYGGAPGELSTAPASVVAESERTWTVSSPSTCGASPLSNLNDPDVPFEKYMRDSLTSVSGGMAAQIEVSISACRQRVKEWDEENTVGYKREKRQVKERVPVTNYQCGNWSTSVDKGASTITTTRTRSCGDVPTGDYQWLVTDVEVDVPVKEKIHHRIDWATLTGSFKITMGGVTREEKFDFGENSDDDVSYPARSGTGHGLGLKQAQQRVRDQLHSKITGAIFAAAGTQAQAYVQKGNAAAAAGQTFEAEHAYYISTRLQRPFVDPSVQKYLDERYRIRGTMLTSALEGRTLSFRDLLPLPEITLRSHDLPHEGYDAVIADNVFRSSFSLHVGGGYASTETTGGGKRGGGLADFAFTFAKKPLGHFRFLGGYVAGHGLVELGAAGGYGLALGGFRLHALSGLGMSTSFGNQERLGPTPDNFIVPVALVWQYGLRASYAFPGLLKGEVTYSKHFRTSTALAAEKRFDASISVGLASFWIRYTEYLNDVDSFFGSFDASTRSAKSLWLLGGLGF